MNPEFIKKINVYLHGIGRVGEYNLNIYLSVPLTAIYLQALFYFITLSL